MSARKSSAPRAVIPRERGASRGDPMRLPRQPKKGFLVGDVVFFAMTTICFLRLILDYIHKKIARSIYIVERTFKHKFTNTIKNLSWYFIKFYTPLF